MRTASGWRRVTVTVVIVFVQELIVGQQMLTILIVLFAAF
jgi:hypothetical protein